MEIENELEDLQNWACERVDGECAHCRYVITSYLDSCNQQDLHEYICPFGNVFDALKDRAEIAADAADKDAHEYKKFVELTCDEKYFLRFLVRQAKNCDGARDVVFTLSTISTEFGYKNVSDAFQFFLNTSVNLWKTKVEISKKVVTILEGYTINGNACLVRLNPRICWADIEEKLKV